MSTQQSTEKTNSLAPSPSTHFIVVGIGTSAGGVTALKTFFKEVKADSDMAYVVILHLSPSHESRLAEILQSVSKISVMQVKETKEKIQKNHVYVIPPNKSMIMEDGFLMLRPITSFEERRAPVDIFFRTLAETHDGHSVAVILTGTGANGSMGVKRVKEKGGIIIVQDPNEAEYSDMPENSISQGFVDFILPLHKIPEQLIHYRDQLKQNKPTLVKDNDNPEETGEAALQHIFRQLRIKTGHDFSSYKRATIIRRISRRMNVQEITDLPTYATFLEENEDEAKILLKDLLISVTNFFRDKAPFEVLEQKVIPRLFKKRKHPGSLRVWVAGCATGEEAYSMAMLLVEHATLVPDAPAIQIFASDIDENALKIARNGLYSNSDVADVSPERLQRFFTKENDDYRIRRELREMILFADHNVLKDPPFSHVDMITCRNLLIYLNRSAQTRLMEIFHFALIPNSYLFLGLSESADAAGDLYAVVDREQSVFQSRAVLSRPVPPAPQMTIPGKFVSKNDFSPALPELQAIERLSLASLHQHILELYAPPSILVNGEYEIVHLSESAGKFLHITGGEPSYNVLKVVRAELRLELRAALYNASQKRSPVQVQKIAVHTGQLEELVTMTVRPVMGETEVARGFLLILFNQAEDVVEAGENHLNGMANTHSEPVLKQLEEELIRTRKHLRSTSELYEVQTEEFKASNEELQAINEELRSAAEELETSKEELQSVNEELTTVNQELKIKIGELSHANDDFKNLINSTDIGTIFLDRNLSVKLFTPAARTIFNLLPADFGRPLSDITNHLVHSTIIQDAEDVMQTLQMAEHEVITKDGKVYLMRIMPYRTTEDHISGAVITFIEITENKKAEENLRISEERFRGIVKQATAGVAQADLQGNLVFVNKRYCEMLGYTEEELLKMKRMEIIHPEDRENAAMAEALLFSDGTPIESEKRYIRKDGSIIWIHNNITVLRNRAGEVQYLLAIVSDISRLKILERQKDEFIGIASHELKTPVTSIKAFTELLHSTIKQSGDEQSIVLVQKLDMQVKRLTNLIKDLLDTTRITESKVPLQMESFDVNELISETVEMVQPTTTNQRIVFAPQTLPSILADRERIMQVLVNILNNAIKYASASKQLVVSASSQHNNVRISVQDFGPGIAEQTKIKIFERFFRCNKNEENTYSGLGLGLYIAAEIVHWHGGEIWVESKEGDGSTFHFTLPLNPEIVA